MSISRFELKIHQYFICLLFIILVIISGSNAWAKDNKDKCEARGGAWVENSSGAGHCFVELKPMSKRDDSESKPVRKDKIAIKEEGVNITSPQHLKPSVKTKKVPLATTTPVPQKIEDHNSARSQVSGDD